MRKYWVTLIVGCFLISSVVVSTAQAERKSLKKPSEGSGEIQITDSKITLVPTLVAGKLTGAPTEYLTEMKDQILYGVGLCVDYNFAPKIVFGGRMEFLWKSIPYDGYGPITTTNFSAYSMYRFSLSTQRSAFNRPEVGFVSGSMSIDGGSSYDLGSHPFIRIGLGVFSYTGSSMNNRLELYYKRILTDESDLDHVLYQAWENFGYIGFELGIGFPL